MNLFIETLSKKYDKKKQIIKQFKSDSSIETLRQLHQVNDEITQLFNRESEAVFQDGISDPVARNYLLKMISDEMEPQTLSIISLLKSENSLILEFEQHQSLNGKAPQIDEIFHSIKLENTLVRRFFTEFKALYQEKIKVGIIGFGEISTVLEISGGATFQRPVPGRRNWVFKKMPIFQNMQQAQSFAVLYKEYWRLLHDEIGLLIPEQRIRIFPVSEDKIRIYALQRKVNTNAVGNNLLQRFNENQGSLLLLRILGELKKVWDFNSNHDNLKVALDGQISNWVVLNFDPEKDQFTGNEQLAYIDTSSPLFRVDGVEQLDAELFLKSTPFFLRPIIRALFLQEVLDRYYDLHLVTVDLIANFYKEGRSEYIPHMVEIANKFFAKQMSHLKVQPLTIEEVTKYYKSDAFIWRFYLAARKIDRFFTEKIRRKKYEFRLPDHVQR